LIERKDLVKEFVSADEGFWIDSVSSAEVWYIFILAIHQSYLSKEFQLNRGVSMKRCVRFFKIAFGSGSARKNSAAIKAKNLPFWEPSKLIEVGSIQKGCTMQMVLKRRQASRTAVHRISSRFSAHVVSIFFCLRARSSSRVVVLWHVFMSQVACGPIF